MVPHCAETKRTFLETPGSLVYIMGHIPASKLKMMVPTWVPYPDHFIRDCHGKHTCITWHRPIIQRECSIHSETEHAYTYAQLHMLATENKNERISHYKQLYQYTDPGAGTTVPSLAMQLHLIEPVTKVPR